MKNDVHLDPFLKLIEVLLVILKEVQAFLGKEQWSNLTDVKIVLVHHLVYRKLIEVPNQCVIHRKVEDLLISSVMIKFVVLMIEDLQHQQDLQLDPINQHLRQMKNSVPIIIMDIILIDVRHLKAIPQIFQCLKEKVLLDQYHQSQSQMPLKRFL